MTPAEKRVKELIDRWLTSIELHLQYVDLPDDAYWKMQAWPKHDRPTRWVLDSAKQKANELKEVFDSRHGMGDSKFADALELTNFLANLVGAQHVDRFVPLAEPKPDTMPKPTPRATPAAPPTSDMPSWYTQAHAAQPKTPPATAAPIRPSPPAKPATPPPAEIDSDATREMPKVRSSPAALAAPAKGEARKAAASRSSSPAPPAKQSGSKSSAAPTAIHQTVITDAVRMLGWGRTWHELAELIARMADRPPLGEVRKILRIHRAAIEKAAK